jgi:hypothetical protein
MATYATISKIVLGFSIFIEITSDNATNKNDQIYVINY